jgi:hypothetical protein
MNSPESKPIPRSPLGFAKLPAPLARFVMPFFLSVVMTCVISGVSSLRAVGLSAAFLPLWLGSWSLSWVFAYPTLLLVLPLARRATAAFVRSE